MILRNKGLLWIIIIKRNLIINKGLYFILEIGLKYWIEYNYDDWFKWIDFVNNI